MKVMIKAQQKLILFFLFFSLLSAFPQRNDGYWQQHVDYAIDVEMNTENFNYSGIQRVIYTNNSPETLDRVFFHLYFNAFQPGSEMDVRSVSISDPDARVKDRISKLSPEDQGWLVVLNLTQDGDLVQYNYEGTILEVVLKNPIKPGQNTVFDMKFTGQVPLLVRRAGKNSPEGVALSMAQWYPKLAEYDFEGWHADPYIGREFYGVWGNFDVKLSIDKRYVVGGTGYLQNGKDVEVVSKNPLNLKNTWHFYAPNVHDFTWAADPDFIHDSIKMEGGPTLNFYYKKTLSEEYLQNWKNLQSITKDLMIFFNENIGSYPYNQYSVIQGGDGGMEYGMCTLITGERAFESLVGVTAHELAHTWFQFLLATNEGKHEWMDEGFTEYFCTQAEAATVSVNEKQYFERAYNRYAKFTGFGIEQPQSTHADRYEYNMAYSVAAYVKGAIFLRQLKYILGDTSFNKTIKNYFDLWSFKHPTPNDFIRCAEKISGFELDWYLTDWTQTTNTIDYGVKSITNTGGKAVIELERIGLMPMPIELEVEFENGTKKQFYIPLQMMRGEKDQPNNTVTLKDWAWAYPSYSFEVGSAVKKVTLDPGADVADVDLSNNVLSSNTLE